MICKICGGSFTNRGKLLLHITNCKEENVFTHPASIPSTSKTGLNENVTDEVQILADCTNYCPSNTVSWEEFVVYGTECVPLSKENKIGKINSVETDKEYVDSRPSSPNEPNDYNGVTDPDWIPLNNENTTDTEVEENCDNQTEQTSSTHKEDNPVIEKELEEINKANAGSDSEDLELRCRKQKRWSKGDPKLWSRTVNKKLRNTGQPYTTDGKNFPAKQPKEPCNIECKYKCTYNFSEEERRNICSTYWSLELYNRKKDFILKHVKSVVPERRRSKFETGKQRKDSKKYFFPKDGVQTRVCQKFLLCTLSISNGPVNSAFRDISLSVSVFSGEDKRGKHIPANKLTDDEVRKIKNHIESFPLTESHYCRKGTSRRYLDSKLSINKMYQLYVELCKQNNDNSEKVPSVTTYKRIFCNNYNYSFFKPKKDQCSLCTKYKLATDEAKIYLAQDYMDHKEREKEGNLAKECDKERASNDPTFVSVTFDMQSVLQIPSTEASPMYYSRKINFFNLTIYENAPPNNAHCFLWNEVNGKRGSIEVGTCLQKFLKQLPQNVKEVSLFSDTCGGQNRNQNIVAVLLHTVQTTNIEVIEQKFLESGHTMMECDSMHSAIESARKHVDVYTMHDWANIFRRARSTRNRKNALPYNVNSLQYKDFIDLSALAKNIMKNKRKDTEGNVVNWLKIKCFRFEKANPEFVFFRYGYHGPYSKINICGRGQGKLILPELKNAYSNLLPITHEKFNDLSKLCNSGVIPSEFHHWYRSLPFSKKNKNLNPEPSVESDSEFCEED